MGSSSKHKTIDLNRCKIEISNSGFGIWKQYTVVFLFYSDISPGGKHCIAKFYLNFVRRQRSKNIVFDKAGYLHFISSKFNYVKKYLSRVPHGNKLIIDNDDYLSGFITLKDFLL